MMSSTIKLRPAMRPWNVTVVTCVMNLVTSLHPTASSHLCREPNTTLATGSNAVTIPFKVFFSFHPFFFFLLSIQWYAMSVCNARLFFKFSFTIKKEKKRTFGSRRFTDFFFKFIRTVLRLWRSCRLFPFPFAIFVLRFFIPEFCFSLATLIPSIHRRKYLTKHTQHTQNVHLRIRKTKKRSRRLSCLSDAGPTPTCLWRTVNPPTPAPECSGSRWGGKPVWGFVVRR